MSEILLESLMIPFDQLGADGFALNPKNSASYTVVLGYPLAEAALRCDLNASIDYGKLATELIFLGMNLPISLVSHWPHIAARYVMSYNLFTPDHKKIDWVRIETGNTVLHQLNHQDASYSHETQDFGHVDIIFETDAFGVYRLNVAPGHSIPLHFHRTMREAELNLTDRMECQGRSLSYGMAFAWPHLLPHIYCNPLNETAKILCVDQPKFIPDDEVVCTSDKPLTWLADRRILNLYQIITGASGS